MAPLVAPILHPINIKTFAFYVPNRILFPKPGWTEKLPNGTTVEHTEELQDWKHTWENFITRGEDGEDDTVLPTWTPTNDDLQPGSLWDYMGLPTNLNGLTAANYPSTQRPIALPKRAYNMIYNEFIRDENYIDKVDLDDPSLKYFCWEKDYFTSALPFQQRGTTPGLPIVSDIELDFNMNLASYPKLPAAQPWDTNEQFLPVIMRPNSSAGESYWSQVYDIWNSAGVPVEAQYGVGIYGGRAIGTGGAYGTSLLDLDAPNSIRATNLAAGEGAMGAFLSRNVSGVAVMGTPNTVTTAPAHAEAVIGKKFLNWLNNQLQNTTILNSNAQGAFNVATLRESFQVQKWMERNARTGGRYVEQLIGRFGENAGDARLDRPEFIGGTKTPVIISEVLQTAQNPTTTGNQPTSSLGTMAGHGISADASRIGNYRCREHGWIIVIAVIRPDPVYAQGLNKMWSRKSWSDYLTPEFVNLSEQAVFNKELMLLPDNNYNEQILGYQGMYNEMRYSENKVTGLMKTHFAHWNLARLFNPSSPPAINKEFLECKPDKRIFAVPSEPGFFCNFGLGVEAVRLLPINPEPGLIDHM